MTTIHTKQATPKPRFTFTDRWLGAVLALPAIVSVFVIILWPLLNTILIGFQKIDIFKHTTRFIGLTNYTKLITDPQFQNSFIITLIYGAIVLGLATFLGMLFGLLLNESFPGRGFFRAILILPWALPWVIIGLLWGWVVDGQFGALNGLLYQTGISGKYIAFLANDQWALFFTALATVWRQASLSGILFLAALQAIPADQYDAAKVDGAGLWHRFRYITLPWLQPTLLIASIINTLYGIMQFDVVFMMTQGGPGDATMLLSILLYRKTFIFSDFGGGAAISNVLALLSLGIGLFFVRLLHKPEPELQV